MIGSDKQGVDGAAFIKVVSVFSKEVIFELVSPQLWEEHFRQIK